MSRRDPEATYRRYIQIIASGDLGALAEVVDPERYQENCVGVTPGGFVAFEPALQSFGQNIYASLPDLSLTHDEIVVCGDLVVARNTARATHTGAAFFGIPTSGKSVTFEMADLARVGEDGRIVWRWLVPDLFSVVRQLGAIGG